jgi:hypothetical protein
MTGRFGGGMHVMRPGFGYGHHCTVITDPGEADLPDRKSTFFLGRRDLVMGRFQGRPLLLQP